MILNLRLEPAVPVLKFLAHDSISREAYALKKAELRIDFRTWKG